MYLIKRLCHDLAQRQATTEHTSGFFRELQLSICGGREGWNSAVKQDDIYAIYNKQFWNASQIYIFTCCIPDTDSNISKEIKIFNYALPFLLKESLYSMMLNVRTNVIL